ncbi:MAG: HPP family protein [Actinomycetes bacterium]
MSRRPAPADLSPHSGVRVGLIVGILMLLLGVVAEVTHLPWVFPSLGASAFILIGLPAAAPASSKFAVCSHLIGITCGALALLVFGLFATPANLTDVSSARVGAIALACFLTTLVMLLLKVPHPPALATTLIVALGLLRTPRDFAVMAMSVVLLVVLARIANYLRGYRLPLWGPPTSQVVTVDIGKALSP